MKEGLRVSEGLFAESVGTMQRK
jgi:hypothetical protein